MHQTETIKSNFTLTAEKISTQTDRLVYCKYCESWDATLKTWLKNCRFCAAPSPHQAPHSLWADRYVPYIGYVFHGSLKIAVTPGSLISTVLQILQAKYKT